MFCGNYEWKFAQFLWLLCDALPDVLAPPTSDSTPIQMKKSALKLTGVAQTKAQPALSKGQKLFNKLLKQIETERQRLLEWQDLMPRYQQEFSKQYESLVKIFESRRTDFVLLLAKVSTNKIFSKKDKAKISDLVAPIAIDLIANDETQQLKAIYNRHADADFDAMPRNAYQGNPYGDEDCPF